MKKLNVFKIKEDIEKSWDEVDFEKDCEIVTTLECETNEECEQIAKEQGYDDSEVYGWTYSELK